METAVFVVSAAVILVGAIGVIASRHPVHAALSLVATLFGVAVLFVAQDAHLLAAVQVIVYAGAIVVLFLFVIMLLGVDRVENLRAEPLTGQRPIAVLVGLLSLAGLVLVLVASATSVTGGESLNEAIVEGTPNVDQVASMLFTDYVLAFELTGVLLTIAVVGAVVLARRAPVTGRRSDESVGSGSTADEDGDR